MPQDNTFIPPITPAPTIPPVQDDGGYLQAPAQDNTAFPMPSTQDNTTFPMSSPQDGAAFPMPSTQDNGSFTGMPTQDSGMLAQPPVQDNTTFAQPSMQDNSGFTQQSQDNPALSNPIPQSDTIVMPDFNFPAEEPIAAPKLPNIYAEVAAKISEAKNVLVALSSDPSVDELSAAIGISLYLDRLGKRATAIYSGSTPNALEFLKPEETFESTADTLQDFVIALNKEKADHLRYKIDGEFVKIYITPYRHRLSEEDLEFSYGDYNVDLVIALDVANGIDLDSALREHGRIMHDAVIINVTTSNPGKFGEIEWSDKKSSSVSEMIATLLYAYGGDNPVAKDEATAYLTGIVAATNRFANAKTTPETMRLCSKLMESGANQQLVSKNITPDIDNELIGLPIDRDRDDSSKTEEEDPTKLDIEHEYEARGKKSSEGESSDAKDESTTEDSDTIDADVTKKEHTLLDDLKAAEQSLVEASAETVPDDNNAALEISSDSSSDSPSSSNESSSDKLTLPTVEEQPVSDSITHMTDNTNQYDPALQDSIAAATTPVEPSTAIFSAPDATDNPATMNTPTVADAPEINGVPEMNYAPTSSESSDSILPPPPTPPIDLSSNVPSMEPTMPTVTTSTTEPDLPVAGAPTTPLGPQPAMQDQVYQPQAADPSAFQIPGSYSS